MSEFEKQRRQKLLDEDFYPDEKAELQSIVLHNRAHRVP